MSGPDRQAYVQGLEIPQRWWELLRCRPLDAVTARAIDGNADLEAAQAAVRIANANTEAARGAFFPQVGASFGSSAQKPAASQVAAGASTSPFSVSTGQLSVSFVPDVFGLTRRQVESLEAQAEVQRFEAEATYLTLTSKLALAAVQEAALRDQIKSTEGSISIAREVLALLTKQLDANEASRVDVATQEAALAQFEQQLFSLTKQLGANRDLMIALSGHLAGEGLVEKFDFACFNLPSDLPLSLPSTIVENRPDVKAAEAGMHSATASVGVAIANRLPQFNLTADAGTTASAITKLASFSSPLLFWSLAGNAAVTLFDGMTLQQKQRAAEAGLDQSAALYRGTVIAAFQNLSDVLQTIEVDRRLYRRRRSWRKGRQAQSRFDAKTSDRGTGEHAAGAERARNVCAGRCEQSTGPGGAALGHRPSLSGAWRQLEKSQIRTKTCAGRRPGITDITCIQAYVKTNHLYAN